MVLKNMSVVMFYKYFLRAIFKL